MNQWNNLDPVIRNTVKFSMFKKSLLNFTRPSHAYVYNVNHYVGLKLLTRLRLILSHLYEHRFRHNFQDTVNPLCSCSLESESTTHFLLHCPFYNNQCIALFVSIRDIDVTISNLSEDNLNIKVLGFESLADRRWFPRMCTFWKIVKGISPTYLQNYLPVIQHSRNLTIVTIVI